MKTIWPLGARDVLLNGQIVRHEDKCWIVNYSAEDDEFPETPKQLRVNMPFSMNVFKPNPSIRGYTVIIDSEFNFGGNLPASIVAGASVK
jgi:hypothetical protein